MKYMRNVNVEIPWYLAPLSVYTYPDRTLRIGPGHVIAFLARYFWFKAPRWLLDYSQRDCVNYYPDYVDPEKNTPASGTKVRTIFGYALVVEENATIPKAWWRNLKKVR